MSDSADSVKNLGIFSTLQSATEARFFLLAMTFVLLIDNVFIQTHQPSLFALATNAKLAAESSIGLKVILIFVVFSFLTSLLLKVLAVISDQIFIETIGRIQIRLSLFLENLFGENNNSSIRKHDCVTLHELGVAAHETKDTYLLNLHDKHHKIWAEDRNSMLQHSLYGFYCLFMLICNWFLGTTANQALSTITIQYLGSPQYIWIAFILLFYLVFYRFLSDSPKKWIYCPTLYRELEKGEKIKREEMERMRAEVRR
ncbi:hypothetical protein ACEU07_18665 [Chromobacterium violaceum]|uniref:hypothetical protein n=1 Tax=Chromobacterium violaceum TaxID=536 RepID=UPI0035A5E980